MADSKTLQTLTLGNLALSIENARLRERLQNSSSPTSSRRGKARQIIANLFSKQTSVRRQAIKQLIRFGAHRLFHKAMFSDTPPITIQDNKWERPSGNGATKLVKSSVIETSPNCVKVFNGFLKKIKDSENVFHVSATKPMKIVLVLGGGGIGDILMGTALVKPLKEKFPNSLIFVYSEHWSVQEIFNKNPLVDGIFHESWGDSLGALQIGLETGHIDMVFDRTCHIPRYVVSPSFLEEHSVHFSLIENSTLVFDALSPLITNSGLAQLSNIIDSHYLEFSGAISGLDIHKESSLYFPLTEYESTIVQRIARLSNYITVRDGSNPLELAASGPGKTRSTKQLPTAMWAQIIDYLREKGLTVVQVGAKNDSPLNHVDYDLTKMGLSINDTATVIKNARFHIDTEGGLVHLAKALHTRSIVFFGPTSSSFFGYEENINLQSSVCMPCWYSNDNWLSVCHRQTEGSPLCFDHIRLSVFSSAVDQIIVDQEKIENYIEQFQSVSWSNSKTMESSKSSLERIHRLLEEDMVASNGKQFDDLGIMWPRKITEIERILDFLRLEETNSRRVTIFHKADLHIGCASYKFKLQAVSLICLPNFLNIPLKSMTLDWILMLDSVSYKTLDSAQKKEIRRLMKNTGVIRNLYLDYEDSLSVNEGEGSSDYNLELIKALKNSHAKNSISSLFHLESLDCEIFFEQIGFQS